jgi:hypothetical protein
MVLTSVSPLKAEIVLVGIYKFSFYLAENAPSGLYKDEFINSLYINDYCISWEL